jgi:hypothetical protein
VAVGCESRNASGGIEISSAFDHPHVEKARTSRHVGLHLAGAAYWIYPHRRFR